MKLRIRVQGKAYEVDVAVVEGVRAAGAAAASGEVAIPESVLRPRSPQKLPEDAFCRSPIAGLVTAVLCAPGDGIRRNQPVLIIDAMKMEVKIGPAVDGTLKAIRVEPGDTVKSGQVLFELC
jgi:biotin carboxyl carrier protein